MVAGDIVKEGFGDESNLCPPFCRICNPQRSNIRIKSIKINLGHLLHAGVSPSCLLLLNVWIPRVEKALAPSHSTCALRQVPISIRYIQLILGNPTWPQIPQKVGMSE